MLSQRSSASTVSTFRSRKRIVSNVKLSLLGTFALFAIYLIMIMKGRRFFIVRGVAFAGSEAERISSIVIIVSAVLGLDCRIIILAFKAN